MLEPFTVNVAVSARTSSDTRAGLMSDRGYCSAGFHVQTAPGEVNRLPSCPAISACAVLCDLEIDLWGIVRRMVVKGGMGHVTQQLARAALEAGAKIETGRSVAGPMLFRNISL